MNAAGLSAAQRRAATATSASCSAGGSVFVHVARGRERIGVDRLARAVDGLVGNRSRPPASAAGAPGVAAIGDQRHLAEPRLQGERRRLQEIYIGRAADIGAVDNRRVEPEILGHREPDQRVGEVGAEHAVDAVLCPMPASERASCTASTMISIGERPGSSPNSVSPTPTIAVAPLSSPVTRRLRRTAPARVENSTTLYPSISPTKAVTASPMRTFSGAVSHDPRHHAGPLGQFDQRDVVVLAIPRPDTDDRRGVDRSPARCRNAVEIGRAAIRAEGARVVNVGRRSPRSAGS